MGRMVAVIRKPILRSYFFAGIVLSAFGSASIRDVLAQSKPKPTLPLSSSNLLVVQGRIIGIDGNVVTLKTPDAYPRRSAGAEVHAQFVAAGLTLRVDVSKSKLLLPDGRQTDKLPLTVNDRVLMVLSGRTDSGPLPLNSPPTSAPVYSAFVVERIVQSDTVATH